MEKLSVIIPTLQKNKELLLKLISSFQDDSSVEEIIVIDNSKEGISQSFSKLKLITPDENLYVNPSWNLGVNQAKCDIVALVNDDITLPDGFCSSVIKKMSPEMGIVGFSRDYIKESKDNPAPPDKTPITLEPIQGRCGHFGVIMFFYKDTYVKIPEDIKIYCGDDWIFHWCKKNKRQNYAIEGQEIYHWGSLSTASNALNPIGDRDRKLYRKYTRKFYQFIFNIEPVFRGVRITIAGIELLIHFDKKH